MAKPYPLVDIWSADPTADIFIHCVWGGKFATHPLEAVVMRLRSRIRNFRICQQVGETRQNDSFGEHSYGTVLVPEPTKFNLGVSACVTPFPTQVGMLPKSDLGALLEEPSSN